MNSKSEFPQFPVVTSQRAFEGKGSQLLQGSARFGGVALYARSDEDMQIHCELFASALDRVTRAHATLARRHVESCVQQEIGMRVDRRVAAALIGSALRTGSIDQIPCAAASSKVFRVYLHSLSRTAFEERLLTVRGRLRLTRSIRVRDVQEVLFPTGGWGTWSSAYHVLARLAQRGAAQYVDTKTFKWPEELDRAIGNHL